MSEYEYYFSHGPLRRNIIDEKIPDLLSEDYYYRICSKEDAKMFINGSDRTIKEQIEGINKEIQRLKIDIDYFLDTYKWIIEEECECNGNTIYSGKLFFLLNNLSYQLRRLIDSLGEYSAKCSFSIYKDWKDSVIEAYELHIENKLNELEKIGSEIKPYAKCVYQWIILNRDNPSEILRCLQEHPSEAVRNEFVRYDENRFSEEVIFSPLVIFCFNELLPYVNDIRDVIKEIKTPKLGQRNVEECVFLYEALYEQFQADHPEFSIEAEEALNNFLYENQLERNGANVKRLINEVLSLLKGSVLGKIWVEYHYNKKKLVEYVVNAEATREQFDEYFRYITKIEYLEEEANKDTICKHFPPYISYEKGLSIYTFLTHKQDKCPKEFISSDTNTESFMYLMGCTPEIPHKLTTITWNYNKQLLRELVEQAFKGLIDSKAITKKRLEKIVPKVFVNCKGEPINLTKNKHVDSNESDSIRDYFTNI